MRARPACKIEGCEREHAARGMCSLHYYRVKKTGSAGTAALQKAPAGTGSKTAQGYIRYGSKLRPMHALIAERAMGKKLPAGAQVHHVNGIKDDNRPENLVVCPDGKYHALLHLRQRALDACGNAGYRICAFCSTYSDPATMQASGSQYRHRDCYNEYQRRRYAAIKSAKEKSCPQ